jgi:hypothetical protein
MGRPSVLDLALVAGTIIIITAGAGSDAGWDGTEINANDTAVWHPARRRFCLSLCPI